MPFESLIMTNPTLLNQHQSAPLTPSCSIITTLLDQPCALSFSSQCRVDAAHVSQPRSAIGKVDIYNARREFLTISIACDG
jgi:hypothetical protein